MGDVHELEALGIAVEVDLGEPFSEWTSGDGGGDDEAGEEGERGPNESTASLNRRSAS